MFYCSESVSLSSLLVLPVTSDREGDIQGCEGPCLGGDSIYGTDSKSDPRPLKASLHCSHEFWEVEIK